MNYSVKKMLGVTLIETMLVMAIIAAVLVAGIRFYGQYEDTANGWRVNQNVEQLFQGMTNYYYANCKNGGTLDPSHVPAPPTTQYSVAIASLTGSGFVTNWKPLNPIVDAAGPGGGYVVQYNRQPSLPPDASMNVHVCYSFSSPNCSTPQAETNSHVVVWNSQVAVKLKDPSKASQYLLLLSANCISSLSGSIVTPCSASPVAGGYLVWQRPATYVSPGSTSSLWVMHPRLQQFAAQYTNDAMAGLSNIYTTMPIGAASITNNSQNYLCGD